MSSSLSQFVLASGSHSLVIVSLKRLLARRIQLVAASEAVHLHVRANTWCCFSKTTSSSPKPVRRSSIMRTHRFTGDYSTPLLSLLNVAGLVASRCCRRHSRSFGGVHEVRGVKDIRGVIAIRNGNHHQRRGSTASHFRRSKVVAEPEELDSSPPYQRARCWLHKSGCLLPDQ